MQQDEGDARKISRRLKWFVVDGPWVPESQAGEPWPERERDSSFWPTEKDDDELFTPGHGLEDGMGSIGLKHRTVITSG